MQKPKNTKIATIFALVLILTMTSTLVALPSVNAHTPAWTIPTWTYVAVTNPTIGVNQEIVIVFWSNTYPPTAQGMYGDLWTFYVDITWPDGTNETLGPFTSDSVGGSYCAYTPTQEGTYTIVARMDEHKITGLPLAAGKTIDTISGAAYVNDTYEASESDPIELVAQQDSIQEWQESPLPTQYWTRPINDANRDWYVLAGNWLSGAVSKTPAGQNYPAGASGGTTTRFAYGTGPESAHIMWATPMWSGGIMDARYGDTGYQTEHYEGLGFLPPIILDGKIYYNVQSLPREGWRVLDLYTGEQVFFYNTTGPVTGVSDTSSGSLSYGSLAFGQILDVENPNQHGGMPYLWSTSGPGSTWMMFDAYTCNYICSIANVSSAGTQVYGKDGSILYYNIVGSGANKRLTVWNTTQAIWWKGTQQQYQNGDYSAFSSNSYWMWRPGLNVTYDGSHAFSLNVSIPDVQGSVLAIREGQFIIGGIAGKNNGSYVQQGHLWALNLKPDSNGVITPTLLWNVTYTPPQTVVADTVSSNDMGRMIGPIVDPEDGVFIFNEGMTRRWWGYSLSTGQLLWGPTASEAQMNFYTSGTSATNYNIYQGKLFSAGWGGVLTAYDIETGEVLWNYTATQIGFESPYGNYNLFFDCIADGKLYMYSGEHSITQPMWRGSYLRCINASNGVELWKTQLWASGNAMRGGAMLADGFLVALNFYDNQIYCLGKGPSATTVTAPDTAVTVGSSFVIRGTVTDQCIGAKAIADEQGFTDGVPAISDESQSAWMEYLYQQQAKPNNATGVPVSIDVIDSNDNYRNIGQTTSDSSGTFSFTWKPDIAGDFTVIATFEGSASYYPSSAETHFTASEAAPTASPYPEVNLPPTETYFAISTLAIIIAIAIVGILLLRKKP